jgi:lipopolysaccharide export system permease protein
MDRRLASNITYFLHYTQVPERIWKKAKPATTGNKDQLIPDSLVTLVKDRALSAVNELRNIVQYHQTDLDTKTKDLRLHEMEWHRKFSLSLSCLILFFIGAPLGSIIRKGGLGMPLVTAIIFFLIFHLLNMFGEKFVKEAVLVPSIGMWLSILVLTPVGIFLTYKALHDSQLFNKEFYSRLLKRIRAGFRNFKKPS